MVLYGLLFLLLSEAASLPFYDKAGEGENGRNPGGYGRSVQAKARTCTVACAVQEG